MLSQYSSLGCEMMIVCFIMIDSPHTRKSSMVSYRLLVRDKPACYACHQPRCCNSRLSVRRQEDWLTQESACWVGPSCLYSRYAAEVGRDRAAAYAV